MAYSRTEHSKETPFSPQQITLGVYKAESYTADGEKIDLFMELITPSNIDAWNTYRTSAASIARDFQRDCEPHSSKWKALGEVPRGAYAKNFSLGDYVVYASKHGAGHSLSTIDGAKDFEQNYNHILMSVDAEFEPKETIMGFVMNEISYTNRGIFRNPVSIVENTHKGLAMLLHGFSAAVAQKFFPEKEYMEVSPIASMQYILYHSLPRDAFANDDEDYEKIGFSAKTMSGGETVNNVLKIVKLSELYFETSTKNEIMANSRDFKERKGNATSVIQETEDEEKALHVSTPTN
ncbi:MAG TPA: hypothetical protein VHD33_01310, partial [Legionellaceae bacterium]|nr:hypothetical protein [Legionellaceae bacterium]